MSYQKKYLKYKNKYLNLKNQLGGAYSNTTQALTEQEIQIMILDTWLISNNITQISSEDSARNSIYNDQKTQFHDDINKIDLNSLMNYLNSVLGCMGFLTKLNDWLKNYINGQLPTESDKNNFIRDNNLIDNQENLFRSYLNIVFNNPSSLPLPFPLIDIIIINTWLIYQKIDYNGLNNLLKSTDDHRLQDLENAVKNIKNIENEYLKIFWDVIDIPNFIRAARGRSTLLVRSGNIPDVNNMNSIISNNPNLFKQNADRVDILKSYLDKNYPPVLQLNFNHYYN